MIYIDFWSIFELVKIWIFLHFLCWNLSFSPVLKQHVKNFPNEKVSPGWSAEKKGGVSSDKFSMMPFLSGFFQNYPSTQNRRTMTNPPLQSKLQKTKNCVFHCVYLMNWSNNWLPFFLTLTFKAFKIKYTSKGAIAFT